MTAVIFGIHGQDGPYLKEILLSNSIRVVGVSRSQGDWICGDVSVMSFVENLIKKEKPSYIFHLAANSEISHQHTFENYATISTGTLNILESVYRHSPYTKVFISGSALQFQNPGKPISETMPFEGRDPYSVARIQSAYSARYYRRLGIRTYIGYFFHHDSPLRSDRHLNMRIVNTVKRVNNGDKNTVELGNIDVVKEYNYSHDMMSAVWTLINQEAIFETVIGSGKGYAIKEWLEICFNKIGRNWEDHVLVKTNYQPDFTTLVSDPSSLLSLGWLPTTDIHGLADLLLTNK